MAVPKIKPLELWAIIDLQNDEPRFCYAHNNKAGGAMAVFDKKPKISKEWKPFKKIIKVKISSITK